MRDSEVSAVHVKVGDKVLCPNGSTAVVVSMTCNGAVLSNGEVIFTAKSLKEAPANVVRWK